MDFVHPYFLIALVAIAIPIIIHLFNFRRYKKVHFTNLQFIEQVRKKTKKKSQIKHLLVLMIRILAITCIVLAFAQPFIPVDNQLRVNKTESIVSIYVDNSFSMQASSKGGSLLEEAKRIAEEIAMAYKQSDVYHLVTNDFERKNQRIVSREELIEALDEIEFSAAVRTIEEVLTRQGDFLAEAGSENRVSFLVSDFQKSITGFDEIHADTSSNIYLVPLMAEQSDNIFIDSCWFENPVHQVQQQTKLFVRIRNVSGTSYEKIPVKLSVNGMQKALASFDLGPDDFVDIIIPYTHHEPGRKMAKLEISDYPIVYDDHYYFSYIVRDMIPVLSIYDREQNPYLQSFFGNDSAFSYKSMQVGRLDYSNLQSHSFILLDQLSRISSGFTQELSKFVDKGGSLAVFPSTDIDLQSYQAFTSQFDASLYSKLDSIESRVTDINIRHPLFNDVFEEWPSRREQQGSNIDLPVALKHYPMQYSSLNMTESLMTLGNDRDFLNIVPFGKGKIYFFASPLDDRFTNLPRHALFVPLLYRMALLSQALYPLSYTIGSFIVRIELPDISITGDKVFKVRKVENGNEFIPEHRATASGTEVILHQQISSAGHYAISKESEDIQILSFNYDRRESDLTLMGEDEIEDMISAFGHNNISIFSSLGKPVSQSIQELNEGIQLWKLFIIFVLIFLAAETILLRLWK